MIEILKNLSRIFGLLHLFWQHICLAFGSFFDHREERPGCLQPRQRCKGWYHWALHKV
jgi:hypothetical protein